MCMRYLRVSRTNVALASLQRLLNLAIPESDIFERILQPTSVKNTIRSILDHEIFHMS